LWIKNTSKETAGILKFVQEMKNILLTGVRGAILGITALGAATVLAWTAAPANPPANNVSAPINIGATTQTKTGSLIVGSGGTSVAIGSGGVAANSFCLGTDCISSWGQAAQVKTQSGTISCSNTTCTSNVTFPSGFFTTAPAVLASPMTFYTSHICDSGGSGGTNTSWAMSMTVTNVTSTGFTFKASNARDSCNAAVIWNASWIAVGN
jgi:hypothetical protein